MDKAIQIGDGESRLVSADEVKARFRGREPFTVHFFCPLCRRPVVPCSMRDSNVRAPHFKHVKNDEAAHQCELYSQSVGYGTVYKRIPLPMFIRPSKTEEGVFVIELGMRPIGAEHIDSFEKKGSTLWVENKPRRITKEGFCGGTFRTPIERPSMKPSSQARVKNLPREYEPYWGAIEDPLTAMIFTYDPITKAGRRLKIGDSVVAGTDFYLVTDDVWTAKQCLSEVERVGRTSTRRAQTFVLKTKVPAKGQGREEAERYLARCGFGVVDKETAPVTVWPPSLQSSGDIVPLFEHAPSVFIAPASKYKSDDDLWLYLHSDEERGGYPRKAPLRRVAGTDQGICIVKRTRPFFYVSANDDVYATAALVQSVDLGNH